MSYEPISETEEVETKKLSKHRNPIYPTLKYPRP